MELATKKIFGFILFLIVLVLIIVLIHEGIIKGFNSILDIGSGWVDKLFS